MGVSAVLVVDDEPVLLDGWAKALRYANYVVHTATTPKAALDLCDAHHFDVVVIDFLMPEMTGLELLHRIRKKLPLVRCIVSSGKIDQTMATEEAVNAALQAELEVERYLHKPVTNPKLVEAVAELVKEPTTPDWKEIAKKTVAADEATLKKTNELVKSLRALKTKKKK
jgi:CheY-like chemotaxis protein